MPILQNYQQFQGAHWETGTVRNALEYMGVKALHTGRPYSEAMLLGISGGAVMGYFTFAYQGYDPQCRILTRNTFDPWDRLLSRMGIVQHVLRTTNSKKAVENLVNVLDEGRPAIVWADMFSLPYNVLPYDQGMWAMMPILVYGYDSTESSVWISDRSRVPLRISTSDLANARSRVKKDKYQIVVLDPPDPQKISMAVKQGLRDCIQLYVEVPPKGSRNNFGLQAYRWWIELLTRPKARMSWEKEFPPGVKMYAGLTSAYADINTFGKEGHAERDIYAQFLDEAATILEIPDLHDAAGLFRKSAEAWDDLSLALLPEDIEQFGKTRRLFQRRHAVFMESGMAGLEEMESIDDELKAIRKDLAINFPLDAKSAEKFREQLAEKVSAIHDLEEKAVMVMVDAMKVSKNSNF